MSSFSVWHWTILAVWWLVLWPLYFLPTIIGLARKHSDGLGIFLLNLFLGWSFVGWVIALVWAVRNTRAVDAAQSTKTV